MSFYAFGLSTRVYQPCSIPQGAFCMRQYGSQSMIGTLRKVLVKRPDEAFSVNDPVGWHYTGRPDLTIARREHDALVQLLRQAGAEVIYHNKAQPDHADAIFRLRLEMASACSGCALL